jgi:hypothetical protein
MDQTEFLTLVKSLAIRAMFLDDYLRTRLLLKGGNFIDLVLKVSPRSSQDIDFSLDGKFENLPEVRDRIEAALGMVFGAQGFQVFDVELDERPPELSDEMRPFWGGYRVSFKIVSHKDFEAFKGQSEQLRRKARVIGKKNSTKFEIDISKFEYCKDRETHDLDGTTIFTYSVEAAAVEKIRAICQQMPEYRAFVKKHQAGRARDFVDIQILSEEFRINFENTAFQELVRRVFAIKRVPLSLIAKIAEYAEDHRADFEAVKATMKAGQELESFEYYVEYVCRRCKPLESLGDM